MKEKWRHVGERMKIEVCFGKYKAFSYVSAKYEIQFVRVTEKYSWGNDYQAMCHAWSLQIFRFSRMNFVIRFWFTLQTKGLSFISH